MNLTLTLLIAFLVVFFLLIVVAKYLVKERKETKELKEKVETQQQNLVELYKHAEEIAEIQKDKSRTDNVIEEAKSDEEVLDIINTIVAINNNRVSDNKKNK